MKLWPVFTALTLIYISLTGEAVGGKWAATYHDFLPERELLDSDDLGSEFNLLYTRKFGEQYSVGAKYGDHSAGSVLIGKVDTCKLWLWVSAKRSSAKSRGAELRSDLLSAQ